ncbi:TPA_asm: Golgi anti-apoptotic protein [Vaccinia virus]|nr:TPA_asm: Golgi anti-apoptotic protein [Vaccinia virus]
MATPSLSAYSSIEDDFNYGSSVASASVHIRMVFLCLQFLLTTATTAVFLYFDCMRTFIQGSPVLILASMFGSIGLIFALTLHRHKHPLNLYLLCGFTLSESLTLASVVTFYNVHVVMQAFILTTAAFLALTHILYNQREISVNLEQDCLLLCGF